MQLSKTSRYAIEALVNLARRDQATLWSSTDIAGKLFPHKSLKLILWKLARAGILESSNTSATGRGYRLARPARTISVLEVVEVFGKPFRTNAGPPSGDALLDQRLQLLCDRSVEQFREELGRVSIEDLAARG